MSGRSVEDALMLAGRRQPYIQFAAVSRMLIPAKWFRAKAWLKMRRLEESPEPGLLLLRHDDGSLVRVDY